jgi:hypothetical protein
LATLAVFPYFIQHCFNCRPSDPTVSEDAEYAESIYSKPIQRIHGKNLCVQDAERLLTYSPNTPIDIKLSISRLITVQHEQFFRSLLSIQDGLE